MPTAVDMRLLNRLDRVIEREGLHAGDAREPVYPLTLLRDVTCWYGLDAPNVLAVTQQWRNERRRFTDVSFNSELKEPDWTADYRHAVAHEWAHIFCMHRGDIFILWRTIEGPDMFNLFVEGVQERQCEYVAAYMLVKQSTLFDLRHASYAEIAAVADVPEQLIPMRWYIWQRFNR